MYDRFLFRDLAGRRIIGAMPDMRDGQWFALLEGGTKLYFREDVPYTRERLGNMDISSFTIGQIAEIAHNPVYGYGTAYYPGEEEAKRQALQDIYILCITEEEMREVPDAEGCIVLIKKKFAECCAEIEDDIRMLG